MDGALPLNTEEVPKDVFQAFEKGWNCPDWIPFIAMKALVDCGYLYGVVDYNVCRIYLKSLTPYLSRIHGASGWVIQLPDDSYQFVATDYWDSGFDYETRVRLLDRPEFRENSKVRIATLREVE